MSLEFLSLLALRASSSLADILTSFSPLADIFLRILKYFCLNLLKEGLLSAYEKAAKVKAAIDSSMEYPTGPKEQSLKHI